VNKFLDMGRKADYKVRAQQLENVMSSAPLATINARGVTEGVRGAGLRLRVSRAHANNGRR
jgi:hypothetical protein